MGSPGVVNKKDGAGETALMIAVDMGHLDIVKELDIEGMARMRKNADVLEYLLERNRVDSLQVIAAHNIARYVKNKAGVEALEIPETVRHFLAGFVDDEDNLGTDDDIDDDSDENLDTDDDLEDNDDESEDRDDDIDEDDDESLETDDDGDDDDDESLDTDDETE